MSCTTNWTWTLPWLLSKVRTVWGRGGGSRKVVEGLLSSIINSAGCLIFDFNCLHKDNGSWCSFCEYSNSHTHCLNSHSSCHSQFVVVVVLVVFVVVLVARKVHQGIKSRPRTASRLDSLALFAEWLRVRHNVRQLVVYICSCISARSDLVNAERRNSIVCLIDMPHATAASNVCDFHAPFYCSQRTEVVVVPFGIQISPKEGKEKETKTKRNEPTKTRGTDEVLKSNLK